MGCGTWYIWLKNLRRMAGTLAAIVTLANRTIAAKIMGC